MQATSPTKTIRPTHNPRRIRRREEWRALFSEYEVSDLSQKAFCDKHQLSMSSFYQWKKKLSVSNKLPVGANFIDISPQPNSDSCENSIPPRSSSTYQIELELGNGMVLRVRGL